AETRIPIGILVMDCALTAASIALPRLSLRILARHYRHFISNGWGQNSGGSDEIRRVLIAGAGDAGGKVAKELRENPQLGLAPVGFIDDDATKHRHQLHGIPVLGPLSRLGELVSSLSVSEVLIALPSARGKVIREIVQASAAAGVRNRTVPGLYEILSGAK